MDIGFMDRFVPLVEAGLKCQTVRANRKDNRPHCKVGDRINLVAGVRSARYRKLHEVTVTHVAKIRMRFGPARCLQIGDGVMESGAFYMDSFARRDGFKDWMELEAFFQLTHKAKDTFEGTVIYWAKPEAACHQNVSTPKPRAKAKKKVTA